MRTALGHAASYIPRVIAHAVTLAGGITSPTLRGGTGANDDLTLEGTSSSTKTSSYVLIQPNGGNVQIGIGAVVDKGTNRFLHTYADPTATGNNLFLGTNAGNLTSSPAGGAASLASNNIGIGTNALVTLTTGKQNVALGPYALQLLDTGYNNMAIGYAAGLSIKGGYDNTMIGHTSGYSITSGYGNVLIGKQAGLSITSGNSNTIIGTDAAVHLSSGINNTMVGTNAGIASTTASHCTAVGLGALQTQTDGYANTAYGYLALKSHTGGMQAHGYNLALGVESFYNNTTGKGNLGIGYSTGFNNITGSFNVFIGHQAGVSETGSYKLLIDVIQRGTEAEGRTKSLIYGIFDADVANQELTFNAGKMGFFGTAAVAKPTGVAVDAAGIHAALVTLGLIAA